MARLHIFGAARLGGFHGAAGAEAVAVLHDRRVSVRGYVEATHAGPTAAVVAFTVALALAVGLGWRTLLVVAAVLTGQLSIGWANDLLDAGRDRRADRREKPLLRGLVSERGLLVGTVVAAALTVPLSLLAGLLAGVAHLVGVACGWAYDLGLKRTSASPLPYFVAFALVPTSFVVLALPGPAWPRPAVVLASGLLGVSAHFTNAVKDLDADAATGVRGLPQKFGARWSGAASGALLLIGSALLLAGSGGLPGLATALAVAAALGALGYTGLLVTGRAAGRAFALNVGAIGLLVAAVVASGSRVVA
jgi:4-hydroxybenzoate polyprenyltransferase